MPGVQLGTSFEDLLRNPEEKEFPEFDITAMVDLVFMMNIYFLVTFVTVAMGEMELPSASHVAALNADEAVILTITRNPDGESALVYIGDGDKGTAIRDVAEQEEQIPDAVEKGEAEGKTAVLLKAEKDVRLEDIHRIMGLATIEGMTVHAAVLEKEKPQ